MTYDKLLEKTTHPTFSYVVLVTEECDTCSCGGNVKKCDFYPEKRK